MPSACTAGQASLGGTADEKDAVNPCDRVSSGWGSQVHLKLFNPAPGRRRTVLLFLFRDRTRTPLSLLQQTWQGDLQQIWSTIAKPEGLEQSSLEDFFEVGCLCGSLRALALGLIRGSACMTGSEMWGGHASAACSAILWG